MQRVIEKSSALPRVMGASLACCLGLAGCLGLGGCADSLSRSDHLAAHAGDAVAANKAIHIIDPWRRESFDTQLPVLGARPANAIRAYRNADGGAGGGGVSPAPAPSVGITQK